MHHKARKGQMDEREQLMSINKGKNKELYHEWAQTASTLVRYTLALNGYEHDLLIDDEERDIRRVIMFDNPSYAERRIKYEYDLDDIYEIVENETHVSRCILEALANHWRNSKSRQAEAVKRKLEVVERPTTLLESTMSTYDLYRTGNEIWAKNLPLNILSEIVYFEQRDDQSQIHDLLRKA